MSVPTDRAVSIGLPGFADIERIGAGGFATVYRATELDTGRKVALKVFNATDLPRQAFESFNREMAALATLNTHPNIVTFYGRRQTDDGRPTLVLELCRESLDARLRTQQRLGVSEALSIAVKISGALESAHRELVFHRDVKPQNILVTEYGEPALADFGIAKLKTEQAAVSGAFGLTILHSAPELLSGDGAPSAVSDVYSLASTTYELLAGTPPFPTAPDESPTALLLRVIREPAPMLNEPGIPREVGELLLAAMSKDPGDRPPTAVDFAERLRAVEELIGRAPTQYKVLSDPSLSDPPRVEHEIDLRFDWTAAAQDDRVVTQAEPEGAWFANAQPRAWTLSTPPVALPESPAARVDEWFERFPATPSTTSTPAGTTTPEPIPRSSNPADWFDRVEPAAAEPETGTWYGREPRRSPAERGANPYRSRPTAGASRRAPTVTPDRNRLPVLNLAALLDAMPAATVGDLTMTIPLPATAASATVSARRRGPKLALAAGAAICAAGIAFWRMR